MASQEILVPDIGNFSDVAIIDVLVKPGDEVQVDTPLITLETEKATMDVPSPAAGVIEKLHVSKGGKVSAGSLIATLAAAGGAAAPAPAAAAPAKPAAPAAPVPAAPAARAPAAAPAAAPTPAAAGAANDKGFAIAHASPSVRQFARELGVDLARVKGTGQKGRVTQDDVKTFVKGAIAAGGAAKPGAAAPAGAGALPKVPVIDFAQFGAVELKPLSRVQKISGKHLAASWLNIPHVTQFDEADITDLEATREKLKGKAAERGIKLTPLAFIIRACVRALQHFPQFNASLDPGGENLIIKKYMHIGFAADTPNGLLVPVIRDADRKDIYQIARALSELSEKARNGKLSGPEMQGGCFTVSSLGGIGGTAFTPIVNAPEVAILGVSRSSMKPVWQNNAFVPRMLLPLSISYDHRVIDGALGARFSTYLAAALGDAKGLIEAVP
jgi:pyruvate dehydrogenase E2 component (dihydrolipoamide acetyltransferase)